MKLAKTKEKGFTLIEMLAVIAIMGIIASLVISMNSAAAATKRKAMVDAEKQRLLAAIDSYYLRLNFYPPDNGNLAGTNAANYDRTAAVNPLLYELTGATVTNGGNDYKVVYTNGGIIHLSGGPDSFSSVFNRGGIANSDPSEQQIFFNPLPLAKDYGSYYPTAPDICGLLVPVPMPDGKPNFWHYDCSSTNRHNPNSFDLWAEYYLGSTNPPNRPITNGNW